MAFNKAKLNDLPSKSSEKPFSCGSMEGLDRKRWCDTTVQPWHVTLDESRNLGWLPNQRA